METQMKKYHKCFTTAEAEKAVLKAENESLTDKLEKSQQQSTLKKLQDAKLQSDYAAAQAVLERIPSDIIKAYAQRGNRERKADQYSALEFSDEEFKKAQMDIQRQYQGLDMQYKSQVKNTMDKVLAEVSTEKELSAVVPKTLVRSNGMQVQKQEFVVQGGIDITDDVIQKLQ